MQRRALHLAAHITPPLTTPASAPLDLPDLLAPGGTLLVMGGLMVGSLGQDRGSVSTRRWARPVGYFGIAASMLVIGIGAVLITTQL